MSSQSTDRVIKTTMVAALAFVTANGNMSADNLESFTTQFCVPKGTTSTGPREITILKDIEGVVLGRKCTVTAQWFPIDAFSKNTTCVKLADAAKGKLYGESKKMEAAAQAMLGEAKEITDIEAKVAKYEEFDAKLAEAKEYRLQPVTVTYEMLVGGFYDIEALAADMEVEVNPVKPTEDADTEAE